MEIERSWALFDSLRSSEPEACSEASTSDLEFHCASCGGLKSFGVDDDLPVCTECGAVESYFISDEPEWRSGCDDSGTVTDKSRVGAPVNTDHFSAGWGQGTVMNVNWKASYSQKRLARINFHSMMNHKDRALFHAYEDLEKIGKGVLKLPDAVMYQAKIKYRAFNEAVLTRGAVRNGIKANCIFQACREFGVARTTQEIADAFGIPVRDLSRTFDMYQEQVPETKVHVTTPADLVPRFFNDVTCVPEAARGKIRMKIVNICRQLEDCVELMGRTPKAVVCTVMFIVLSDAGFAPNKAEICKICDVSVPTLGKIEGIVKSQLKT